MSVEKNYSHYCDIKERVWILKMVLQKDKGNFFVFNMV